MTTLSRHIRRKVRLPGCLAICVALVTQMACAQPAQSTAVQPPASPPTQSYLYTRDAALVDAYVPVITMEQLGDSQNNLQGYRIQIFKDGRAIYQGWREVKTLGEVRFDITPEQVQKIQAEFAKYKFWQVPEDQYGLPKGMGGQGWLFTLRDGARSKTVRADGSGHIAVWRKIIEDEVKSFRWRCPFVDDRSGEKCDVLDQRSRHSLEWFMTRELPKFMETYK